MVMPINPSNPLVIALHEITEPILAPIRQVMPRFGMLDLSPMVAILVLQLISRVISDL